jgi:peptide deformylase
VVVDARATGDAAAPPVVMVNPEILECSAERVKGWEGCLSVPGLRGLVPRHRALTVRWVDLAGQGHEMACADLVARIVQHEVDHLDGLVYLDRLETTRDLVAEGEFLRRSVEGEPATPAGA